MVRRADTSARVGSTAGPVFPRATDSRRAAGVLTNFETTQRTRLAQELANRPR